jgi:ParB family chromosome partitioning protein
MAKGLEILIPKASKNAEPQKKDSIFWIEINKIKTNPFQPRKTFDKQDLKELASSIEKYGILQPLLVKKIKKEVPTGEKVEYQLIAGERRLRASTLVGLKEVPVIIEDIQKEDELPISLVENIQREDLNAVEKGMAYKELIQQHNFTQKQIGDIVGKSREAVANTLRLLDLPEEIRNSIINKEISEGHARALLGIDEKDRLDIFKDIVKNKLPVREVEKRNKKSVARKEQSPSVVKLERNIAEKSGAQSAKLQEKNNKVELKLFFETKKAFTTFIKKIG